jgi:hypothetical protein
MLPSKKMNRYNLLLVVCSWFFIMSCKEPEIIKKDIQNGNEEHFSFILYDGLYWDIIPPIKNKLQENYIRVLNDLSIDSLRKITVKIWNNENDFLDDMQNTLGIKYPGAGGWVYKGTELKILHRGQNTAQTVLHEFCHAASLVVNNRFGNNPRWLWEAVAIFEAGEFIEPENISYLVFKNFPTIAELNSDFNTGNHNIYEVGYLLVEYIIKDFGKDAYINLIKSNGNIDSALGISTAKFENNWKTFVISKYLEGH